MEELKREILEYIRELYDKLGEKDIKIEEIIEIREEFVPHAFGGIYRDGERWVISISPETKVMRSIVYHEAYHIYVKLKYGEDIDRMKDLEVDGSYSEGPAYLLQLYEELKERKGSMIERLKELLVRLKRIKPEEAEKILEEEGENLLIKRDYREVIIITLRRFIYGSLTYNLHLSPFYRPSIYEFEAIVANRMANKIMELFDKNLKRFEDIERALIETLKNYPEYRREIIESFLRHKSV